MVVIVKHDLSSGVCAETHGWEKLRSSMIRPMIQPQGKTAATPRFKPTSPLPSTLGANKNVTTGQPSAQLVILTTE
jgi:hypothetical protein